jgi:hypothetical protein
MMMSLDHFAHDVLQPTQIKPPLSFSINQEQGGCSHWGFHLLLLEDSSRPSRGEGFGAKFNLDVVGQRIIVVIDSQDGVEIPVGPQGLHSQTNLPAPVSLHAHHIQAAIRRRGCYRLIFLRHLCGWELDPDPIECAQPRPVSSSHSAYISPSRNASCPLL